MWNERTIPLIGGLMSGLFYYLISIGEANNGPSLYLPVMPLLLLGLWRGTRPLLTAAALSLLVVLLIVGPMGVAKHAVFSCLPAWLFIRQTFWQYESRQGGVKWYPMSQTMMDLTLYAVGFYVLFCLGVADQNGGIQSFVQRYINDMIQTMPDEMRGSATDVSTDWDFVVPPVRIWLWVITFYVVARVSNYVLKEFGQHKRDSMAILPFIVPLWVLIGLIFTGAFALFTGGQAEFIGKTLFLMLLLPYFLSGIATADTYIRRHPSGSWWMAGIYVLIVLAIWPVMVFILFGIVRQLQFWLGALSPDQDVR